MGMILQEQGLKLFLIHKHYEKYWRSGLTQQQAAQEIKHGHYNRFAGAVLNKISSLSRDLPKQPLDITAIFGSISTTLQISAVCKITSDKYGFSAPVQIAENNALSEEIFNLAVIAAANI